MTKAFIRIPASLIEHYLNGNEAPEELNEALEKAVKNARENDQYGGEAPIEVFIVDDSDAETEDTER